MAPVAASGTFIIDVTQVNDTPTVGNNSVSIVEGESKLISLNDMSATDVDNLDGSLLLVVANLSGGQFESTSAPGIAITSFTVSEIQNGTIQFVDDGDEFAPSYDVFVTDELANSVLVSADVDFTNVNDEESGSREQCPSN